MESNNINRTSATGLNSVEIDELNTNKIIIDDKDYNVFTNIILRAFPKI
jgi:hypothetical protein